jgi:hypothetical protein
MLSGPPQQDSLAFRVEPLPATAAGRPVPISLTLTNRAMHPMTVAMQGRPPAFDITVARRDGQVVWRRLAGQVVPAILAVRTLAPAETLTFTATWNGRAADGSPPAPGRYIVTGSLPSDPPEVLTTPPEPLELRAGTPAK